jgi:hypothetical protein
MPSEVAYKLNKGSRAQVMHGTAKATEGGLTKSDLKYNKHGKIVSRKQSLRAKKDKRLAKSGWGFTKGKFGAVKLNTTRKEKKSKK